MKKLSIKHQLIVFLLICLISIPLTALGFRHYFDDARLKEDLTLTYLADDFKLIVGHAKLARSATRSTLLIDSIKQQKTNIVKLPNLAIDTRFYDEALIHFAEKQRFQPINAILHYRDSKKNITYPILYTNKLTSRIPLDKKVETGAVLSELQLATNHLFSTYRIESVEFVPKRVELKEFVMLIALSYSDILNDKKASNLPIFMQLKFVLFIYFCLVAILFAIYLLLLRKPVLTALWAALVMVWLVFDGVYLVQRTQQSALLKLANSDKALLDKLINGEKYFVEPTSLNLLAEEFSGNKPNDTISQREKKPKADKKTTEIRQTKSPQEDNLNDEKQAVIRRNEVKLQKVDSSAVKLPKTEIPPETEEMPDIILESLSDFEDEISDTVTEQGNTDATKEPKP